MAVDISASIIPLHLPKARKPPLTAAERAKNYRERKKAKAETPAIWLPSRLPAPQKITFGRGLLIYCSDYKCSRSAAMSADR